MPTPSHSLCMRLQRVGAPLTPELRETPAPQRGQVLLKVRACGVCRTDLHVVDGELPPLARPVIPGHEIVGEVIACGEGASLRPGARVGVPWLGYTCGVCAFCANDQENLCDAAQFTGYQLDGGYAQHVIADERYCFALPDAFDDVHAAPLLCAGLVGYRSLRMTGDAQHLGVYGFGAAAHIVAQVARWRGQRVYAFTRPGDAPAQKFALDLGAHWAGDSDCDAARTARRRNHLRAGRLARSVCARGAAQGRRARVRRNSHERHPRVSLFALVGRARRTIGCESHPTRRRRVHGDRRARAAAHAR